MKETKVGRFSQHRLSFLAAVAAITLLIISSIVIIPRAISVHPGPGIGPNARYVPSKSFGDTDDLPGGSIKSPRQGLAAGSASVSGVVTDSSTGKPVANAQVGISLGQVGSA